MTEITEAMIEQGRVVTKLPPPHPCLCGHSTIHHANDAHRGCDKCGCTKFKSDWDLGGIE